MRATKPALGFVVAHGLDAMRHACFSIWRIERPHEPTGLIITDVLREKAAWLVDEHLILSANSGDCGQGCKAGHACFGPRLSIQPMYHP